MTSAIQEENYHRKLTDVIRCMVNDEDYSESTKLELLEAMSQDIGFSNDEE